MATSNRCCQNSGHDGSYHRANLAEEPRPCSARIVSRPPCPAENGEPRWARRPSPDGPAGAASTNALAPSSMTSSSPPISCCLPSCGACATNSAFTMWLSSSCNGASRSATRPSGRGSSGLRQWSLTVCAQSVVVRPGVPWYVDETYIKVSGRWCYLYWAIDRDGNLLDSMLSEHRDRETSRRFLRRLIDAQGHKPLRLATDKHPAYTKAMRWIVGRKAQRRQNQYLNNWMEQHHRPIKQRYYPMLGFGRFESASRFCAAFDELRNYLRPTGSSHNRITAAERRTVFSVRWSMLMTELAA